MSRPPSLDGRAVTWSEIVDNHNLSALMRKAFSGHVVAHHWSATGECLCVIAERSGQIYIKHATELVLKSTVDALPDAKFLQ